MTKVFFTSHDGTVWINKSHMKDIIKKTLKDIYPRSTKRRFADLLIGYLDSLYYKEEPGDIKVNSPDVDYFYCGGCRRGFPVKYTKEMIRSEHRPCPRCGAQSYMPKEEKNEKKNNRKS